MLIQLNDVTLDVRDRGAGTPMVLLDGWPSGVERKGSMQSRI
jgi:hypothetical protein